MKRPLPSAQPGVERWVEFDPSGETYTIVKREDVGPTLDWLKEKRNAFTGYLGTPDDEWHHIARIPMTVVAEWKKAYNVDVLNPEHLPQVLRLLNDIDFYKLRATTGKV